MKCLVTGAARNHMGQFKRIRKQWSLENFDDGYVDASGRMRVWSPGHHRASSAGYVLRAIIAYEAYHNVKVTRDQNIHHKDHDRLNDSKENLEKLSHHAHAKEHNPCQKILRVCQDKTCNKPFKVKKHKVMEGKAKFCSRFCANANKPKRMVR